MSYLGFSKILAKDFLSQFNKPKVLEIGLDRGQTTLPLIYNMSLYCNGFTFVGIDIKVQSCFHEQLSQMGDLRMFGDSFQSEKSVLLYEKNSLDWLKDKNQMNYHGKFDLIMIDGDHNYHTVFNELKMLENFTHNHTLIVCDDYLGKHSEKDNFIIETGDSFQRENKHIKPPVRLERTGVKNAIMDYISGSSISFGTPVVFLSSGISWNLVHWGSMEPCFIWKSEYLGVNWKPMSEDNYRLRDSKLVLNFKKETSSKHTSEVHQSYNGELPEFNNRK